MTRLLNAPTPPARRTYFNILLLSLAAAAACSGDDGVTPVDGGPVPIALEVVQGGFTRPLFVTAPAGDTDRLFVVERGGLVRILEGGAVLPTPFLDVSGSITAAGNEQGLLGLAFHPQHATNGLFYVDYTDTNGDTRVVRYHVSANPDVADPASAAEVLAVDQPAANHNGGMLAFGPDGMLYVALGDGGGAGDLDNNGQSPSTLLGSLLRLDVDGAAPYQIPLGNPFAGHATYRGEIWAYGLRNPWRFSFDRQRGDLYIGDVGQGAVEEIDFQPASSAGGENYGWHVMEGSSCYNPSSGCSTAGLELPIQEYSHSDGCSITGGYVYRGSDYPQLRGRYYYGDYCSGWIRSFVVSGGTANDLQDHSADVAPVSQLASFGEDGRGELYVVSLGGTVYRVTPAGT